MILFQEKPLIIECVGNLSALEDLTLASGENQTQFRNK